jgi:hypothetical protein
MPMSAPIREWMMCRPDFPAPRMNPTTRVLGTVTDTTCRPDCFGSWRSPHLGDRSRPEAFPLGRASTRSEPSERPKVVDSIFDRVPCHRFPRPREKTRDQPRVEESGHTPGIAAARGDPGQTDLGCVSSAGSRSNGFSQNGRCCAWAPRWCACQPGSVVADLHR